MGCGVWAGVPKHRVREPCQEVTATRTAALVFVLSLDSNSRGTAGVSPGTGAASEKWGNTYYTVEHTTSRADLLNPCHPPHDALRLPVANRRTWKNPLEATRFLPARWPHPLLPSARRWRVTVASNPICSAPAGICPPRRWIRLGMRQGRRPRRWIQEKEEGEADVVADDAV